MDSKLSKVVRTEDSPKGNSVKSKKSRFLGRVCRPVFDHEASGLILDSKKALSLEK